MLKRQLLVTVSTLALTGLASAADLPARMPVKAMPAPVIVQLWAGPYIGINGGAVWHRQETNTTLSGAPYHATEQTETGATFGGQLGYNWQAQNLVYGLEVDANWIGVSKTRSFPPAVGILYTTKLNWLATARARAGIAAGRTLFYATGGLAIAGVEDNWTFTGGPCCVVESNETRVGWTAGGGIEHFISNPHVTVKAEVLYVDLGSRTQSSVDNIYTSRFKNTSVIGRLGVNLKW
jgi:outer membrane immunogenic protein